MKLTILLLTFFTFSTSIFAQTGKVEGKVTDANSGAVLSGVSVSIEGNKAIATTNIDGYFVINVDAGKKYSIKLTSIGYQTKEITDVEAAAGQLTHIEILLEKGTKTEEGVVVRATSARKESAAALITYQKNTAVVAQVVSAETIRRSPDKNTGDVLKRVPGASLQQGKYLVVRGLADRYNQAMLNGVLLSSTEPDRKTFSFDIIPSNLVDNIIINKSFIPELPGEWAGGLIQVNTKDVPAKNFFNVQIGTGFNTATLGKEFYAYEGSGTDWLGFDNGKRALPDNFPTKTNFAQLSLAEKAAYGKQFENIWTANKKSSNFTPGLNESVAFNFGFNKKLGSKNKLAAIFAVNYNKSSKRLVYKSQIYTIASDIPSVSLDFDDNTKYSQDVLAGALANITLQLGSNSKISFKNLLNINTTNYFTSRGGFNNDIQLPVKASELAFKANAFFNTLLSGDHNIKKYNAKFHWFGSFNILDQYIPDQRRLEYRLTKDPLNPGTSY
ncbi:MAG: carboxypeptidase-like regulatory domain-containing protein, partial [Ferruginibacter sp.]